jgi:arylsulfatase A-like enzyme
MESDMKQPNILIFMTDQQRGDSIPPYSKAKTPHLDKFCGEGLTFSRAFTIAPHCCPSRASFFSGLYPSEHGVWNNVNVGNSLSRGLYRGVKLWSEDFHEAGYEMAYSGKWHVSDVESPLDRGFDRMTVPSPSPKKTIEHERPHVREWEQYVNFKAQESSAGPRSGDGSPPLERKEAEIIRPGYKTYTHYGVRDNPFHDNNVIDDAVQILAQRRNDGRPWCQFVGPLGPHDPYFVPQEYLDLYSLDDIELPASFSDRMADKPSLYRRTREKFDQLSEREHREAVRHYLAFCTYEDALFGRVLEALEKSGESENTLVLYVSDHGDYMAEHGLWCKGLPCFEGAYHIPAVIRWPGEIANPGRMEESFISLVDFAPTFLEAAGINPGRSFSGKSLVPFLRGEKPPDWEDAVYTQSNGNEQYGIQRSIRTRDWKLVYNGYDYDELYDLRSDPDQMRNLIAGGGQDPKYEKIVHELFTRLWQFAYRVNDVCINPYVMVSLATEGPGVAFQA